MPQANDAAYDLSTPATFLSEAEAIDTNTYFSLIFFCFFRLRRNQVKKERKNINQSLSYHLHISEDIKNTDHNQKELYVVRL